MNTMKLLTIKGGIEILLHALQPFTNEYTTPVGQQAAAENLNFSGSILEKFGEKKWPIHNQAYAWISLVRNRLREGVDVFSQIFPPPLLPHSL